MNRRLSPLLSARIVFGVLLRPRLWGTAVGVLRSHSVRSASGKAQLVPRLARPYLDFRLETQYGPELDASNRESEERAQGLISGDVEDVLKYLEWVREWNARG